MRLQVDSFGRAAPLTTFLFVLDIALYLFTASRSGDFVNIHGNVLHALYGSTPEGLWDGEWLRLVAPNFLHGSLLHILVNMMALRSLGPITEQHFGSADFGTVYILSGVTGFCASQMIGGSLAIGASASLFGMLGAGLMAMIMRAPTWKGAYHHPGVRNYLFWIALNLFLGFSLSSVDNWAHLGGLVSGALLGACFDLLQQHKRGAYVGLIATFVLIAAIICTARWTFYNPYYHVYTGARAIEEEHNDAKGEQQFREALTWAKLWHKEEITAATIAAYQSGDWKLSDAREYGFRGVAHGVLQWWRNQPQ